MGENVRFKNGHMRVETSVFKTLACRMKIGGFFKHWKTAWRCVLENARVTFEKYSGMWEPLAWRSASANLKNAACRGLRVGPSKE